MISLGRGEAPRLAVCKAIVVRQLGGETSNKYLESFPPSSSSYKKSSRPFGSSRSCPWFRLSCFLWGWVCCPNDQCCNLVVKVVHIRFPCVSSHLWWCPRLRWWTPRSSWSSHRPCWRLLTAREKGSHRNVPKIPSVLKYWSSVLSHSQLFAFFKREILISW